MLRPIRRFITGTPLVAVPAIAADPGTQTGITSVGPAMFLFTIASALLLVLVFRSAANRIVTWVTSRIGVFRIRRALAQHSKHVLHDFIIPGAHGGLAKIDHAIFTAGGILCIESKHCNGMVFGGKDEAQWTNVDGVHRRRFLNPLIRNEGRARALRRIVPGVPVDNLVIFTGAVEFPAPPAQNVIRVDQLESYVARHVFGPSRIEDWDAVWLSVRSAILRDEAARKDFDAQISFG
ncbi:MAG: NERD domain-containing protein [Gammaproteobacteria bacterium]|nr:NERD domain-containing protein [Gammaproteobacteria bacterium]MBT8093555.1 NERD domain-containing protein [Gammaproteobacteria bacterium]MBT8106481.1 NERD domain-containing protein [Gammaproteobacteria bacterium]NNF49372.1 NERD domain-containing protein [Woeseiaceae bacterium]NNK26496.1 NERD domain-containing protein [Woeseiaceae bacterium]